MSADVSTHNGGSGFELYGAAIEDSVHTLVYGNDAIQWESVLTAPAFDLIDYGVPQYYNQMGTYSSDQTFPPEVGFGANLDASPLLLDLSTASVSSQLVSVSKTLTYSINSNTSEASHAPSSSPPNEQPHPPGSRNHTASNKPFACNRGGCNRSYTRYAELSRHQKEHSGSRPYNCSFFGCKRAGRNGFVRKDHLKQHLRGVHRTYN